MPFFSKEQKELALKRSSQDIKVLYEYSEKQLKACAKTGSVYKLSEAMKKHQMFEYALLYQLTPEYKEKISKGR